MVNTKVTAIKKNVIFAENTADQTQAEIAADTIINALGSKKNVFDISGISIPVTFAVD